MQKMGNIGSCEPYGKSTCQVCDHIERTLLQQNHLGKYLKFKVGPLTVTQKMHFTF